MIFFCCGSGANGKLIALGSGVFVSVLFELLLGLFSLYIVATSVRLERRLLQCQNFLSRMSQQKPSQIFARSLLFVLD